MTDKACPSAPTDGIALRAVMLVLLGSLGGMQAGLWAFLGFSAAGGLGLALLLAAALWGAARMPGWHGRVAWRDLALCIAVAAGLLALGGEGRWFYANTDWQVRLAVLRDMTVHPWPFAYDVPGGPTILRAPLGMYLGPALLGKVTGATRAAEMAMWAQNSLLLGLVLAAGSVLFAGGRAKLAGLVIFLGFSGMDIVGQAIAGRPLTLHLEQWAGFQFSSALTQMFWVPQHGLAGWIFAAAYMAWRRGMIPRAVLGMLLPLLPLLSPLAAVGCVPFALHAYAGSRRQGGRREGGWRDALVWPALAGLACLPGLLYLVIAGDSVGASPTPLPLTSYPIFVLLEIGGFLLALRLRPDAGVYGAASAWIVVFSLLLIPFGRVGAGMDFAMRASIPALAILAVMAAEILTQALLFAAWRPAGRVALAAWLVGLATPMGEIGRAVLWPRAPEVVCGYYGVVPGGYATYIAPQARFPALLRPHATLVKPLDPPRCWNGPWPDAVDGRMVTSHPGRG